MARRRMQGTINSIKHIVQLPLTTVDLSTMSNVSVVDAVVAPAASTTFQVTEGSLVKAIYFEIWMVNIGAVGTTGSFNITVEKRPANAPAMTIAQAVVQQAYPNKKNILYTTQGIIGSTSAGSALPMLKHWIAIPKGKQRMGLGDEVIINLANLASVDYQVCGVFIYKEYR